MRPAAQMWPPRRQQAVSAVGRGTAAEEPSRAEGELQVPACGLPGSLPRCTMTMAARQKTEALVTAPALPGAVLPCVQTPLAPDPRDLKSAAVVCRSWRLAAYIHSFV